MSIFTGATSQEKLAGVFGLSCYLLLSNKVQGMIPKETPNKDTPFFMGHGDQDPLVKISWGQRTAAALEQFGYKVDFKSYRYVLIVLFLAFLLIFGQWTTSLCRS